MTSGIVCAFEGRLGKNAKLRHVKGGELAMLAVEGKNEGETLWARLEVLAHVLRP